MAEEIEVVPTETPEVKTPETPAADASEETLLGTDPDNPKIKAAEKVEETPEAKLSRETLEADNKKLLGTDDKDLTDEQKVKKAELKAQEAKAVPEKYEVKVEGYEINQPLLETLTPIFKKHNLTQEAVQELATAYAPVIKAQIEADSQVKIAEWKKQIEGWKTETKTQLGAEYAKELSHAYKFINKFAGSKEDAQSLRTLLEETGVGNHPLMAKLFINGGKAISQDSFVDPNKNSQGAPEDPYNHRDSKAQLK